MKPYLERDMAKPYSLANCWPKNDNVYTWLVGFELFLDQIQILLLLLREQFDVFE